MGEIPLDTSTGFVPEGELIELADAPDDLFAGPSTILCASAVISAASAVSSAIGDACPTTACTSRC